MDTKIYKIGNCSKKYDNKPKCKAVRFKKRQKLL